jgi:hypothetical protein
MKGIQFMLFLQTNCGKLHEKKSIATGNENLHMKEIIENILK